MEFAVKDLDIPSCIVQVWQRIVDAISVSLSVPAVLITRIEPPDLEIIRANISRNNPFPSGSRMPLLGLYCAATAQTRQRNRVEDARLDPLWADSPTARSGIVSYLGYPLLWPDGDIFGTICAVDTKANKWVAPSDTLLQTVKDAIEAHLALVAATEKLRASQEELEQRVQQRTAEVRQTFKDLSRERQRLYDLLETLPVMIFMIAPDHRMAFANRLLRRKLGENLRGKRCYEYLMHRDEPCGFCRAFDVLKTQAPYRWELNIHDGSVFSTYNYPFVDIDGSSLILGITLDITEQRRTEKEREQLKEQLHHAHKMEAIGTLAGGIAHDFNNMLAVIIGNAELALEDIKEEEARGNLEQILLASRRSRDLVKQILTFSRKDRRDAKMVEIVAVARETYGLLRASLPATIRMELKARAKANTTVLADPSEIQQVIVNLANNAAHAMREAGGTLTIGLSTVTRHRSSLYKDIKPGRYVKLTVSDTGNGIAPEVRERMFEPFFTTKEPGQGTGMGLSVVYGIVNGYGGSIQAESEIGKGSRFIVFLPQAEVLFPPAQGEKRDDAAVFRPAQAHILFVDDEPAIVRMASVLLERLGYTVTAVTGSTEALKLFNKAPYAFDLLITDQTMPDMTGLALARSLLAVRKDLPIILTTGYSETMSPEKAKEAGIREFVLKPITKTEISEAIRRVLSPPDTA
jgi:signal transduction histidine kinase/ActR/RegA family two-component response regulator